MKIRSRPSGSMKAGRRKPVVKPSMNREMCASLRPKGPVRKVPTSYDCSAGSPGFNGGQHTYGGQAELSPGRSSSHHDVARNLLRKDFTGRFTETFMDRASRPPVTPQGRDWRFRAVVWRPGLPPAGTAGSDSGKATTPSRVMRRGPFHHHHQPARLPPTAPPVHSHHPAERRLVVPTRPWPTGAHVGVVRQGLRCYRLYGDIS